MDQTLDHIAQYNDLDAGYQQAHVTAMVMKSAYAIVGANPRPGEAEYPPVTIESPLEVHVEPAPATKRVVAAIRRRHDRAPDGAIRHYLTLYRPDYTVTFVTAPEAGGYVEVARDDHGPDKVLVVPIVDRPQLWAPLGTSESADVTPLSDAACKNRHGHDDQRGVRREAETVCAGLPALSSRGFVEGLHNRAHNVA
ncbi:hypothetical protein [Amycolatopsis sp. NPDC021455]|uniref:hypothetical protein n=1 Tax=Amycolatopsis sp. NPDC021455 TaxID=3154901 RepID=UPI0034011D49